MEIQILVSINKVLNFVNKNFVEVHFLSCYINIYLRALSLPFGSQSLQYILSGSLQKIFAGRGVFIQKRFYRKTRSCMFILLCFVSKSGIL